MCLYLSIAAYAGMLLAGDLGIPRLTKKGLDSLTLGCCCAQHCDDNSTCLPLGSKEARLFLGGSASAWSLLFGSASSPARRSGSSDVF